MTGMFAIANDELAASAIPASIAERRVYDQVKHHKGHRNPVSIDALRRVTGLNERAIKEAVAELLVTHKIMIGARRSQPVGYYMIVTAEDQEVAASVYRAQILAMLKRLRVLDSPHKVREFLGQQVATLE